MIEEILSQNGTSPEDRVLALPLPKLFELDKELQTTPRTGCWEKMRRAANEAFEAQWQLQVALRNALGCPMC